MTEKHRDGDGDITPTDSELIRKFPLELDIIQQTDSRVLEKRILDHAEKNFSSEDYLLIRKANAFIKGLYGDKTRKFTDTPAINHAYRVTLAGDNSAAYKTVIKLLHDSIEDFKVDPEFISDYFGGPEGELIRQGVEAFTKGEKESYPAYLTRLKEVSQKNVQLSFLVGDKIADMIDNCLDPVGLPVNVKRKANTRGGMTEFLNKIDNHAGILVSKNNFRSNKLADAKTLARRGLSRENLTLAA